MQFTGGQDPGKQLLGASVTMTAPKLPATMDEVSHLPLPPDLKNEIRDALEALIVPPARLTLRTLLEGAIRRELDRLSDRYNQGLPFPRRMLTDHDG
jgi:hypothetical protein